MDHLMDTGTTSQMTAIDYSLAAMREYRFNVFVDQTGSYTNYVTDTKTVQHSGYWVKYNSETPSPGRHASIDTQGQIGPNDIDAEALIYSSKPYLLLKNNLRSATGWDPSPSYKLQLKYTVDVIEYSYVSANNTEI